MLFRAKFQTDMEDTGFFACHYIMLVQSVQHQQITHENTRL